MALLTNFLTRRGARAAGHRTHLADLRFAGAATITAFTPSAYNSATRTVVMKQIYFTAWQILPGFTLFAALLSYVLIQIVVTTAARYGLSEYALEVSMRLLVLELLPLITALFVALRLGSAINTEVALMRIHGEIEALEDAGVDTLRLEFMPRVIGGMISVLALTAACSVLALVLAYLAVYGPQTWSFPDFTRVMGKVFPAPTCRPAAQEPDIRPGGDGDSGDRGPGHAAQAVHGAHFGAARHGAAILRPDADRGGLPGHQVHMKYL